MNTLSNAVKSQFPFETVERPPFSRWWLLAVLGSLVWCLVAATIEAGHNATPYGTTDFAGNPLGFNEPITLELAAMLVENATWADFKQVIGPYYFSCLAMHLVGIALLLIPRLPGLVTTLFFGVQPLLFPIGLLGLVVLAFWRVGWESPDGELLQDTPFTMMLASAGWIAVSVAIAFQGCARAWANRLISANSPALHPQLDPV